MLGLGFIPEERLAPLKGNNLFIEEMLADSRSLGVNTNYNFWPPVGFKWVKLGVVWLGENKWSTPILPNLGLQ